jgi:hypothetical protein
LKKTNETGPPTMITTAKPQPAAINSDAWANALLAVARGHSLSPSPEETTLFLLNSRHLPIR